MKSLKRNIVYIIFSSLLLFILISGCSNQQVSESTESSQRITNDEELETVQNLKSEHIKPIELESSDYSDLEFLKEILEDKRVVMLGESSHGVAEYNQIKGRLIQFLHEELGYNVVAFESGLTEVGSTNEILAEIDTITALKNSLFQPWHTTKNNILFNYFKQEKSTNQPINIAGFDMQAMGGLEGKSLYQLVEGIDLEYAKAIKVAEKEFYNLTVKETINKIPEDWNEKAKGLVDQYNNMLSELNNENSLLSRSFDENVIQLLRKSFEQRIYSLSNIFNNEEYHTSMTGFNLRDKTMSENLVWLLEEMYPNEKFVVWAHNAHIMKYRSKVKTADNYPSPIFVSFVENLPESIKEDSYIIGLYMYSGKNKGNDQEVMDVSTDHKTHSIENFLNQPGFPASFINIDIDDDTENKYWWNSEITSKYWGVTEETFIPSEQYDGLIQIDKVNPPIYFP
ncbi:erythromycin esterase family protein [Cytobacillus sp. IB215665]|uniref:erythromycin esterase family protein n=1 Tax=Cytobacillus sp. IB215665 TaxID=3097357 RepID=UPI002A115736|nr:erythromycin esterase family protein [Cytobacillus sp. IB215665]MDX8367675.1 erythromycin esterase family protein [Cytobacillus sp. IB215665]